RTNTAADRSSQRTFDSNDIFTDSRQSIVREPGIELVECFLPCIYFIPCDLLLAFVSFLYSGVQNTLGSPPNIASRAISFDKRNDRVVRYLKYAVFNSNLLAFGRQGKLFELSHDFISSS